MNPSKPTRGGARPNSGRKKASEESVNFQIRLPKSLSEKFKQVGGRKWLMEELLKL